jgi:hypothetical protein
MQSPWSWSPFPHAFQAWHLEIVTATQAITKQIHICCAACGLEMRAVESAIDDASLVLVVLDWLFSSIGGLVIMGDRKGGGDTKAAGQGMDGRRARGGPSLSSPISIPRVL